jgi:hypothetical protein
VLGGLAVEKGPTAQERGTREQHLQKNEVTPSNASSGATRAMLARTIGTALLAMPTVGRQRVRCDSTCQPRSGQVPANPVPTGPTNVPTKACLLRLLFGLLFSVPRVQPFTALNDTGLHNGLMENLDYRARWESYFRNSPSPGAANSGAR